jgi:ethanolamine ammonia-lyase small subunit
MAEIITLRGNKTQRQVIENPWRKLKEFTSARIALGRSGNSIPTHEFLSFQLDHARAMDAVHCALDTRVLVEQLRDLPKFESVLQQEPLIVESKVRDRLMYLQRPDLGRQLDDLAWDKLKDIANSIEEDIDLAIVIADGLSSTAIQNHAIPVMHRLLSLLNQDIEHPKKVAPICIVKQGRVAVADDVSECLSAKMVLILIGERPGLTSPDSMGMYLTWAARRGSKDSQRNCISNIRPEGLGYDEACQKAFYLINEAFKMKLSGIHLKDRSEHEECLSEGLESSRNNNFLISQL